jgi:pimeloyl-ACP methyl ester carboxylesterase
MGKKVFATAPLVRKVFYKLINAKDYERAPLNMRETMKNLITVDLAPKLHEIKIPTLIIWGKKDAETPVSDAKLMHSKIADSKLVIIEDTGHSPHKTHPAKVAEEIAGFLS